MEASEAPGTIQSKKKSRSAAPARCSEAGALFLGLAIS